VGEGGGVRLFFLGPQVSANYYNKKLYNDGKGIFPVPLKDTFFPPANEDMLKPEVTGDDHILCATTCFQHRAFPIFGAVFKDREQRYFLKNLPIKRYFPVPRSQWRPEPAGWTSWPPFPTSRPSPPTSGPPSRSSRPPHEQDPGKRGIQGIPARLERHRKIIEHLVGPTSDKKSYHLPGPWTTCSMTRARKRSGPNFPT